MPVTRTDNSLVSKSVKEIDSFLLLAAQQHELPCSWLMALLTSVPRSCVNWRFPKACQVYFALTYSGRADSNATSRMCLPIDSSTYHDCVELCRLCRIRFIRSRFFDVRNTKDLFDSVTPLTILLYVRAIGLFSRCDLTSYLGLCTHLTITFFSSGRYWCWFAVNLWYHHHHQMLLLPRYWTYYNKNLPHSSL